MKTGKIVQYIVAALVVIVLFCGIFTIAKRLKGSSSADTVNKENNSSSSDSKKSQKNKKDKKGEEEEEAEEADNSIPMTKMKLTAPAGYLREGDTMPLDIRYKPSDATNTKLKWTCSEEDLVSVSEDGILTPAEGSGGHTVTVTAKSTDGSKLKESFELRILPKIDPSKPMIAITFDDGPNPSTTNAILDALEENYARATFFCLGNHVEDYPEVVQREYELGMEVATHTYSHKDIANSSQDVIDSEISKGVKAIKNAIGVKPTLMRSPYGGYPKGSSRMDPRIRETAKKYGLSCINWSVDTLDWKGKSPDFTYQAVMKAGDGDIVLLHDIHEYNVDAVKRFVPDLISEGYQLLTVTELYETFHELNKDTYSKEKNDMDLLIPGTAHNSPWPRGEATGESAESSGKTSGTTSSKNSGSATKTGSAEDGEVPLDDSVNQDD